LAIINSAVILYLAIRLVRFPGEIVVKKFSIRAIIGVLSLWSGVQFCRADLIVKQDGSVVEGKVVSRDAKGLTVQAEGQKTALQMAAESVARVIVTDEKGMLLEQAKGVSSPGKAPERKFNVPVEPAGPKIETASPSSYYVIPFHGVVGETVTSQGLEKSLADAVKRKAPVVVLDINSPGGLVSEAEEMIKILHQYNKQLRIVVLADQNLSAAAITSLSVREIYVKATSITGAATAYNPENLLLPADIREKMQSAWRAVARNSAQEGGHEPLLAEAMIDSSKQLHLETIDGKKVVKEGPGENIICQKGRILTLTSREAVNCGLAVALADDYAELGVALRMPGWAECPGLGREMAAYLEKRWTSFEQQSKELEAELSRHLSAARDAAPDSDVVTQRVVTTPAMPGQIGPVGPSIPMGGRGGGGFGGRGGGFVGPTVPTVPMGRGGRGTGMVTQSVVTSRTVSTEMRAKWKERSLATVVALQEVERVAQEEMLLAKAFGRDEMADEIKEALPIIANARAEMYANRNKYLQDAGAVAGTAPGRGPAPAAAAPLALKMTPLPAKFSEIVKSSVSNKTYKASPVNGGATPPIPIGSDYEEVTDGGGVLIGLRCGISRVGSATDIVSSVQPVYLTTKGVVTGKIYGNPAPAQVIDLIARDGYAVGGGKLLGASVLQTVVLKFMRITETGLDPKDSYDSQQIGTNAGAFPVGGSTAAVGISGKTNNAERLSLALIFLPTQGTPPAATGPLAGGGGRGTTPAALKITPLTPALAATVKQATDKKSYKLSPIIGGSQVKEGFTNVSADGVLIGLRCGMGKSGTTEIIVSVQPVFLTTTGVVMGRLHGVSTATRIVDMTARDGYVVGGAKVNGNVNLEGVKLTFVRLADGKLNPKDAYESETAGNIDKATVLNSPTPVIGITGEEVGVGEVEDFLEENALAGGRGVDGALVEEAGADVGFGVFGQAGGEGGEGFLVAVEVGEGCAAVEVKVWEVGELRQNLIDEGEALIGFELGIFDGPDDEEGFVREAALEKLTGDPEFAVGGHPARGARDGGFEGLDGVGILLQQETMFCRICSGDRDHRGRWRRHGGRNRGPGRSCLRGRACRPGRGGGGRDRDWGGCARRRKRRGL
jgi:hypothetical protein